MKINLYPQKIWILFFLFSILFFEKNLLGLLFLPLFFFLKGLSSQFFFSYLLLFSLFLSLSEKGEINPNRDSTVFSSGWVQTFKEVKVKKIKGSLLFLKCKSGESGWFRVKKFHLFRPGDKLKLSGVFRGDGTPFNPFYNFKGGMDGDGPLSRLFISLREDGIKSGIEIYRGFLPTPLIKILAAAFFGEGRILNLREKDWFLDNGLLHLLAVSGFHFSIWLGMITFLIPKKGGPLFPLLVLTFFIPTFLLFFGENPSVLRAAVMGALSGLILIFSGKNLHLNSWWCAFFMVWFFLGPKEEELGFFLSFAATLGVLFSLEHLNSCSLGLPLIVGFSAQLATLPFLWVVGMTPGLKAFLAAPFLTLILFPITLFLSPLPFLSWCGFSTGGLSLLSQNLGSLFLKITSF